MQSAKCKNRNFALLVFHFAFCVAFCIIAPSCALPARLSHKPIEQNLEPQEVLRRLSELKSFRFYLQYFTDVPVRIRAQFSGIFNQPDIESWDGFYVKNGKKVRAVLRARAEVQMQLSDAGWQTQPRGLETMIVKQIEQVLTGAKLEFLREEKGRVLYQFEPQMSLIDPLRVKRLKGVVELDGVSGLPVRLFCFDENGAAKWEVRIDRYNRAGRVEMPFVPVMRLSLVPQSRSLLKGQRQEVMRILKERFKDFGLEHRLKWMGSALSLEIDRAMTIQALRLLTSKGRIEIYQGSWVRQGQDSSIYPVVPVAGDAARMIHLDTLLADNSLIDAEVDCTLPVQPKLIIKLQNTDEGRRETEVIGLHSSLLGQFALVVDGAVVDVTEEITENRLVFADLGNEETVRILAALANNPPLPVDLGLVVKER
ncbi:MAG: hypothetical protein ABIK23_00530 [candidate division WOR-3 bacterium]